MSKKVENNNEFKGSPIKKVTDSLNKNGKIKGASKKETRVLKGMCVHHRLKKNGQAKPDIHNDGNGEITCKMCGESFSTNIPSEKELDKMIDTLAELNNQAKFIAVRVDAGEETIKYLAGLGVSLNNFKKTYEKLSEMGKKQDNAKGKKKNKNKNSDKGTGGSSNYGNWG